MRAAGPLIDASRRRDPCRSARPLQRSRRPTTVASASDQASTDATSTSTRSAERPTRPLPVRATTAAVAAAGSSRVRVGRDLESSRRQTRSSSGCRRPLQALGLAAARGPISARLKRSKPGLTLDQESGEVWGSVRGCGRAWREHADAGSRQRHHDHPRADGCPRTDPQTSPRQSLKETEKEVSAPAPYRSPCWSGCSARRSLPSWRPCRPGRRAASSSRRSPGPARRAGSSGSRCRLPGPT